MPSPRRHSFALLISAAIIAVAALSGCAASVRSDGAGASAPPTTASATASPGASAAGDPYAAFCDANRAAAEAKAGTVGEDLAAVTAQGEAARAILPLTGVSADVAAGAEVFVRAIDENAGILAQFPADDLVSDVGLDPKFTESEAVRNAASDPNYRAFIAWTIDTCALGTGG